jgi:hypothetical protein
VDELCIAVEGLAEHDAPAPRAARLACEALDELGPRACRFATEWVLPVPSRAGHATVTRALAGMLTKHAPLRTLHTRDGHGELRRHVLGDCRLTVPVEDAPERRVVERVVAAVRTMAAEPFRHARELPLRARLLTVHGRPHTLVLVFSYLAGPFAETARYAQELAGALLRPEPQSGPGTGAEAVPGTGVEALPGTGAEAVPGTRAGRRGLGGDGPGETLTPGDGARRPEPLLAVQYVIRADGVNRPWSGKIWSSTVQ